jgi:hypothetical protein
MDSISAKVAANYKKGVLARRKAKLAKLVAKEVKRKEQLKKKKVEEKQAQAQISMFSPASPSPSLKKIADDPVACGKLVTYCDAQPYRCSIKKLFMDMPGQFDHISRQSISKKMDVVFAKANKPTDPNELNPAALKKAKLDPAAMMAAARAGGNLKSDDEGKYLYCDLFFQTGILTPTTHVFLQVMGVLRLILHRRPQPSSRRLLSPPLLLHLSTPMMRS